MSTALMVFITGVLCFKFWESESNDTGVQENW